MKRMAENRNENNDDQVRLEKICGQKDGYIIFKTLSIKYFPSITGP